MQAIETKCLPATNTRGTRVIAATGNGVHRLTVKVGQMEHDEAHAYAARELATSLGWHGDWIEASTRAGYVFAIVARDGRECARAFTVTRPE